jgi:hypothetical protein
MPRRNRVTPFGEVIATEARGLLYGNRGVLHDDQGRLVRDRGVRRWIACRLEFKGRRRPLLRPGRFTELFFLDEATALAAGHRPCAECRREDFVRFRDGWAETHPGASLRVDDIDRVLQDERVGPDKRKRLHDATLGDLPDGSMIAEGDRAWLLLGGELLGWTPFGYEGRRPATKSARVQALTPPSISRVIRFGYRPNVHPSALSADATPVDHPHTRG